LRRCSLNRRPPPLYTRKALRFFSITIKWNWTLVNPNKILGRATLAQMGLANA
jgi:hypothetical protein